MKKRIVFIAILAILFVGCSDLFTDMVNKDKTGNSDVKVEGTGLDAGFVIQTPLNKDASLSSSNRIAFDKDKKNYQLTLGTNDGKVDFTCIPEDENAKVYYAVYKYEDKNGNVLPTPQRIFMSSVNGNKATLSGYGYGKFKVVTKIVSDDPKFSTEYTTDITRLYSAGLEVETPNNPFKNSSSRIDFDEDTKDYYLNFSSLDESVDFITNPIDKDATVVYTAYKVEDEDGNVIPKEVININQNGNNANLENYGYGKFEIVAEIISDDPELCDKYTTHIHRIKDSLVIKSPNNPVNSTNNRIDFDKDTLVYDINLGYPDDTVSFETLPDDESFRVEYEAYKIENDEGGQIFPKEAININQNGNNATLENYGYGKFEVITNFISDTNPELNKTYTTNITRVDDSSNDPPTLTSMNLEGLADGENKDPQMTVSPSGFSSDVKDYTIKVNEDVDILNVDVESSNYSVVSYTLYDKDNNKIAEYTDVPNPININPLSGGNYRLEIKVEEDGKETQYNLTVDKPRDDLTALKRDTNEQKGVIFTNEDGSNAGISAINPAIKQNLDEGGDYSVDVSSYEGTDITSGVLRLVPLHKYATIKACDVISGGNFSIEEISKEDDDPDNAKRFRISDLKPGDNNILITIESKEAIATRTHQINIKTAPSNSTELQLFKVKVANDENVTNKNGIYSLESNVVGNPLENRNYNIMRINNTIHPENPSKNQAMTSYYYLYSEKKYGEIELKPFDAQANITVKSIENVQVDDSYEIDGYTGGGDITEYNYTFVDNLFKVHNLPAGDTIVTFRVTAEDGVATRDFNVTFKKSDPSCNIIRSMTSKAYKSDGNEVGIRYIRGYSKPMRPVSGDKYNTAGWGSTTYYLSSITDKFEIDVKKFTHDGAVLDGNATISEYTHYSNGNPYNGSPSVIPPNLEFTDSKMTVTSIPVGVSKITLSVKPEHSNSVPATYEMYILKPSIEDNRLSRFVVSHENNHNSWKKFSGFWPHHNGHTYNEDRLVTSSFYKVKFGAKARSEGAHIKYVITDPDNQELANSEVVGGFETVLYPQNEAIKTGCYRIVVTVSPDNDFDDDDNRIYIGEVYVGLPAEARLKTMDVKYSATLGTINLISSPVFTTNSEPNSDGYEYKGMSNMTENRDYSKAIKVSLEPTDSLAKFDVSSITGSSDYSATWDKANKLLTINDYADVGTLELPIKVLSQRYWNVQENGGTPNEDWSKTYTLKIDIPKFETIATATEKPLPAPFENDDYQVGLKGTTKMAYRFGSMKDVDDINNPLHITKNIGGIDIIGSSDSGNNWINSSENSSDNSPVSGDLRGGFHHKVSVNGVGSWVNIPADYNNGSDIAISGTDLTFAVNASVEYAGDRGYVKLSYTLKNTGSSDLTDVKLGICSDSEINSVQDGPKFIRTRYGAYLTETEANKTLGLYLLDGVGVTPITSFWAGQFNYEYEDVSLFDNTTGIDTTLDSFINGSQDQAVAFGWTIPTIDANGSVVKSFRVSIGDYLEKEND